MRLTRLARICCSFYGYLYGYLGLLALQAMPVAAQQLAHVHGEALLTVAVDASRVEIALDIPADSLWGFEYAPKTRAEQDKVAAAKTRLADSASVLQFPAAAQCVQRSVSWQDNRQHNHHAHHAGHDHAKHVVNEEHAVKDQHADKAQQSENDDHQNIVITYQVDCAKAEQLTEFDVTLLHNFAAVQRVRVQWVDNTRQLEKTLTAESATFSLESE